MTKPSNHQNGKTQNGKTSETHHLSNGVSTKEVVNSMEFGGPVGCGIMMFFFPLLMYYLWACVEFNQGHLLTPFQIQAKWDVILRTAWPTFLAAKMYFGLIIFEAILALTMPGPIVKGLPIPHLGNKQLLYHCNGVWSWWVTIITAVILHISGVFPLTLIVDNFGALMTVAIVFGHTVTWVTYFLTILTGTQHRMTGLFFYDVFMGANLNPRLGRLDLKMFAEIRVPWVILFFVSLSMALKQYQVHGVIQPEAIFMVLAHFLYTNACMKGEECIPTTWDIFYEKWGFMLIFWNFAGVPFTYVLSTFYMLHKTPTIHHHPLYTGILFVVLLAAYYIWDTANSQKNHFRMQCAGTYVPRTAFPQLPWCTLEKPKYLKTKAGSYLLIDGWWKYGRKIHYTADLTMSLSWGLITGFGSIIPYFYPIFFFVVLTHRTTRDIQRCSRKYGEDWVKYCKEVPYTFIPGIY